jgi:alpha-beta hydrolase superfamily lysophospholipase
MESTTLNIVADDGMSLFARRWLPDGGTGTPRVVVQIAHGMAEHSGRYARTAERLCAAGFDVWADDHRGHGETARGFLLGHPADQDGFFRVVRDLKLWSDEIARTRPGLPIFLLGHSWGSFLAQAYIERYPEKLAGCALSGTRGPGGAQVAAGAILASIIAAVGGPARYSKLLRTLADGGANERFKPNRTAFDWLSRDEAVVDAYTADPLCGFHCSAAFYRDLANGLRVIHRSDMMARIPKKLPIYVFSGAADPIGLDGRSPTSLVEAYRNHGLTDLEFVLYPQARHETLNETNKDEVIGALISWLDRHLR